jgi:hypothetical protein
MRDPWLPIATHGDTEDEIRAALLEWSAHAAAEFRSKLRAEGLPLRAVETAMALLDRMQRAQIEKDLPTIMKNMAITAGAARCH